MKTQLNLGLGNSTDAIPLHETPAFRLAEQSPDYLTDTELLSLLLQNHINIKDSVRIAQQTIANCGGLCNLAALTFPELRQLPDIGKRGAEIIISAISLGRRLQRGDLSLKPNLSNPITVVNHMEPVIGHLPHEEFHVLLLNVKNQLIKSQMVSKGLLDRSLVHPREVFRPAIQHNCARIILVHNHPTGDPTPSQQDITATEQLVQTGEITQIPVLDHVIIGKPAPLRREHWISMRAEGHIKQTQ